MKTKFVLLISVIIVVLIGLSAPVRAHPLWTASSYGGVFSNWPSTWVAVNSLNDPDDLLSNERIDFVGNSSAPGLQYAGNSQYLFFRVRVDDGAVTEFSDTIMILIDQDQNGTPDYAFMWDSQSNDQTNHGLELGVFSTEGTTWATTRMDDRDGNNAKKIAPPDFGLSNGDGYIRILNGQPTTGFGTTTFVDFAINWNFLSSNSTLAKGQTWNIQLGSINNANDHNFINYDVAGGLAPTDNRTFPGTVTFSPTAVTVETIASDSSLGGFPYWMALAVIFSLGSLGIVSRLFYRSRRTQ